MPHTGGFDRAFVRSRYNRKAYSMLYFVRKVSGLPRRASLPSCRACFARSIRSRQSLSGNGTPSSAADPLGSVADASVSAVSRDMFASFKVDVTQIWNHSTSPINKRALAGRGKFHCCLPHLSAKLRYTARTNRSGLSPQWASRSAVGAVAATSSSVWPSASRRATRSRTVSSMSR